MTEQKHPKGRLEAFITGQMSEEENEAILSHLADCDQCLSVADGYWQQEIGDVLKIQPPELDPEIAERVEHLVLSRIHHTDLADQVLLFGSLGLFISWKALLRPFLIRSKRTIQAKEGISDGYRNDFHRNY